MANEAKFSVIFPASGIISSQMDTFETLVNKNGLPVSLPLSKDNAGNFVISSGLSLRDAQILRRQVASYGFNADVVSDAVRAQSANADVFSGAANDLQNRAQEAGVDVLESMELPNIDLGLSDGDNLDEENPEWSGENWLNPDVTSSRTLSINAQALLEVAKGSAEFSFDDLNAVQEVPILENVANSSKDLAEPLKALTPEMLKESDEKPTVTSLMKDQISIEDDEEDLRTQDNDGIRTADQYSLSLDDDSDKDMTAIIDRRESQKMTLVEESPLSHDIPDPSIPLLTAANEEKSDASDNAESEEDAASTDISPIVDSDILPKTPETPEPSAQFPGRRLIDPNTSIDLHELEALKKINPEPPKPKSKFPVFIVILLIVLVAGLLGCYYLYFMR